MDGHTLLRVEGLGTQTVSISLQGKVKKLYWQSLWNVVASLPGSEPRSYLMGARRRCPATCGRDLLQTCLEDDRRRDFLGRSATEVDVQDSESTDSLSDDNEADVQDIEFNFDVLLHTALSAPSQSASTHPLPQAFPLPENSFTND